MSLPRPKPSVVFKVVPEGAILLATESEIYFSLNPMGVRVWQLLPPASQDENEIVAQLRSDFPDVSEERIAADVRSLVEALVGQGLVEPDVA